MNEDFGLDWYDYGARWYDAAIGRWNAVDALADEPEQIDKSVYAYAWNNPVNLTDPDGNCPSCKSLRDFAVFRYNQTKGLVSSVANSAVSLVRLQLDPSYQRQTVEGIAYAVSNPRETFSALKEGVAETISDAATGDPATAGEAQGRIAGTLLGVVAGAKGAGAISKTGKFIPRGPGAKGAKPVKMGTYKEAGGHHVHAKAGFKNHPIYDPKKGFSISQEFMREHGLDHTAMTKAQRQMFDQLAKSGQPNSLEAHTIIARNALIAGGASKKMANQLIEKSLQNLYNQGVKNPSHIPWNKKK